MSVLDRLPEAARRVYEGCQQLHPALVSQDELTRFMGAGEEGNGLKDVLNLLLRERLLETFQQGAALLFRSIPVSEAAQMTDLQGDDEIVFAAIRAAGNEGIWTKTLKARTNLHQNVVARCLKSLESRQLVKAVKSVKQPGRKIYMLYGVTPASDITGGVWFTDQELDTEFVNTLTTGIYRYIRSRSVPKGALGAQQTYAPSYQGYPTIPQITEWLRKSGLTQVQLDEGDIKSLVNVLIFDGKVEQYSDGVGYRAIKGHSERGPDAFTESPSGQLASQQLSIGMTALEQEYFDVWLKL